MTSEKKKEDRRLNTASQELMEKDDKPHNDAEKENPRETERNRRLQYLRGGHESRV